MPFYLNEIFTRKNRYVLYLFLAWSTFVAFSLFLTIHGEQKAVLGEAAIEARTHLELNLEYRSLISRLGGVYASVETTCPNPYLDVPNRDIKAGDGNKLTLLNPAYMTRLIFEAVKEKSSVPVINKITSLKFLNPVNAPDEWEKKVLRAFEKKQSEASEIASIKGEPYLRLMRPFMTENSCLKCHGHQGYKEGDVRGAISIAVPLRPYYELAARTRNISILTYALLWVVGCIGLVVFSRFKQKQEKRLIESEWKFRTASESANDWEYWLSEGGAVVYMSPSVRTITGYGPEEFVDDPGLLIDIIHPEDRRLYIDHLQSFEDRHHEEIQFRIISRDGRIRWLAHICAPLYMHDRFLGRRTSNRDVTDRKLAEEALRESYERIQDLYNNAPCGYHSLDKDGMFVRINDTELRWLQYARDEVIGKMKFSDLITPGSLKTFDANFPILKSQGGVRDLEFEMVRKDGTLLPVILSASAIRDKSGTFLMSRSTMFDVTERKRTEEELRKYRELLEELVRQRTSELEEMTRELARSNADLQQFASVVAHDLQTPLQGIALFATILEKHSKGRFDEKADECVKYIIDGVERTKMLIKDLLEYSRLDAKKEIFRSVNCSVVLEEALCNLRPDIKESSAEITYDTLPAVKGDASQLISLFQNLIGNAIKFRREKSPKVHIAAQQEGDGWIFSVRDNGIGIDPQYFQQIFVVFQRLHAAEEYEGTGIGLAICKKIVERHGGRIWVESERGKGSTFYFTISDRSGDAVHA